jgi:mannose-P-dolichol utilization defect protein 1
VYGSLVVKAPQIVKILMNCSILGISFSSIVIEAIMYFMMMGYNIHKGYPFSIYGENVFLGVSNIFIMACFFVFCKEKKYSTYIKGTLLLFGISIPLIFQLAPNFNI